MSVVEVKKQGNITTVTLNRPEVRNAFDDNMIEEMTKAFKSIQQDSQVRAVFLRGEGESFSAGGDLNWMKSMVNYTRQENVKDSEKLYDMYRALAGIPVPVVCFVHGHAMGGALGLIAASDICFAAEGTQFCFSEVRLGLAPAVISAFVKNKLSISQMSRYFLTAEVFESEQALAMGLVHEVGEKDATSAMALQLAQKVAKNGPHAVRATKALIQDLLSPEIQLKKRTTELIADLRVSDEGQEGLKAFFDKRKPSWLENK